MPFVSYATTVIRASEGPEPAIARPRAGYPRPIDLIELS